MLLIRDLRRCLQTRSMRACEMGRSARCADAWSYHRGSRPLIANQRLVFVGVVRLQRQAVYPT
jgi:hypothetical protein